VPRVPSAAVWRTARRLSTAVDALEDLGLTFKDLDGLSPEQQFKLLADRISQVEDPTRKAAIAMSLFGRTGTNLLPMFAAGAKGIEALQKEGRPPADGSGKHSTWSRAPPKPNAAKRSGISLSSPVAVT